MLHALEHEAMVYGLTLNISKSEHLIQPGQEGNNLTFSSGDPVPTTTCSKYLGSQITWQKPTDTALTARFGLASAAYKSLRTIWNSRLTIRVKLRIFQSVIVSTLIFSLDSLTMLPKHFRRLNSFFFRLLRRVVGVKAAYISRVSNITVWELAGHPTTPAQIILQQQTKLAIKMPGYSAERPFSSRCVLFSLERPNRMQQKIIPGKTTTSLVITHVRLLTATHQPLFSTPPPDHKPNDPPTTYT